MGTNGGAPTYGKLIDLIEEVAAIDGADQNGGMFIINPQTRSVPA